MGDFGGDFGGGFRWGIPGGIPGGILWKFSTWGLWVKLREDSVERTFSKENERKLSQKMEYFVSHKSVEDFMTVCNLGGFGDNLKKIQ